VWTYAIRPASVVDPYPITKLAPGFPLRLSGKRGFKESYNPKYALQRSAQLYQEAKYIPSVYDDPSD
jgi:hypothetical protein